MGRDPSGKSPPDELPAAPISWEQAVEFCRRLSDLPQEKAAGRAYRLPTEAEWEYACRAGTTTRFAFGDSLAATQANFGKKITLASLQRPDEPRRPAERPDRPRPGGRDRPLPPAQRPSPPAGNPPADDRTQHPLEPAGLFPPNAWGLCDMHGSVWEWCSDFYAPDAYKAGPFVDPTGPKTGKSHVLRGGCWSSPAEQCTSAYRNGQPQPSAREPLPLYGFRVVCQPPG